MEFNHKEESTMKALGVNEDHFANCHKKIVAFVITRILNDEELTASMIASKVHEIFDYNEILLMATTIVADRIEDATEMAMKNIGNNLFGKN